MHNGNNLFLIYINILIPIRILLKPTSVSPILLINLLIKIHNLTVVAGIIPTSIKITQQIYPVSRITLNFISFINKILKCQSFCIRYFNYEQIYNIYCLIQNFQTYFHEKYNNIIQLFTSVYMPYILIQLIL